jgi:hypothetical protein
VTYLLREVATILGGDLVEAQEIIDAAYDVVAWREKGNPYSLAILLAQHHVAQRSKVGLLRRWRNGPLTKDR